MTPGNLYENTATSERKSIRRQKAYDTSKEIQDSPMESLGSPFSDISNEIDFATLSMATDFLSEKITKETKTLFKKTSDQVKRSTTYKEGIRLIDELQNDILRRKEKVHNAAMTNIDEENKSAESASDKSSRLTDTDESIDMVDGEENNIGICNYQQQVGEHLTATTLVNVVANETQKIVKLTTDQLKKTSKYQESVRFLDDLRTDLGKMLELKEIKAKSLMKAEFILSYKDKDYRPKELPGIFGQFVCLLVDLKSDLDLYESSVTSQEAKTYQETIIFSLRESLHVSRNFLRNQHYEKELFALHDRHSIHLTHPTLEFIITNTEPHVLRNSHKEFPLIPETPAKYTYVFRNNSRQGNTKLGRIPSNHFLFLLHEETKNSPYSATFISFINLCNDHNHLEDLFSELLLDYTCWRETIRLFMDKNKPHFKDDELSKISLVTIIHLPIFQINRSGS